MNVSAATTPTLKTSYELLDGEAEVAPGLRLLPTPGHSPGHQSLVVETSAGTVVIAGQDTDTRGVEGRR